jgi:hypothetical protein
MFASQVLHKGDSRLARTRRRDFGDKLISAFCAAAAAIAAEKTCKSLWSVHGLVFAQDGGEADGGEANGGGSEESQGIGDVGSASEDGPLRILGSLPGLEALQVVSAMEEACLGAQVVEVRRRRDELLVDHRVESEIRDALESMIERVAKLHAMPRGTVVCAGKSKRVIDYCRSVVDFLDCCGNGLFQAAEKPVGVVPPQPCKLLEGVATTVPSDVIVRLHLKLLALLRNEYRADTKSIPATDALVWPEMLRRAMESQLLLRATNMVLERKENGEVLNIIFDDEGDEQADEEEDDDEAADSRRNARAYLRFYADYFAEELEVVEHLKRACYSTMPELLRWRALDWLCSSVAETEDGTVRQELERRFSGYRVLEKLQDQMRPQNLQQLTPDLRAVAAALNATLLEDLKSYGWFSAPVDAEKLGLLDYHEVVKTPMDLGTVLSNLIKVRL